MNELTLDSSIAARVVELSRAGLPLEVCGLLGGMEGRVSTLYEMTNSDQSAIHYAMVPEEQFKISKAMRAVGEEMLAIYHSHPATPARPSAEDIRLAVTPNVVHVIISMKDSEAPVMKGFTIEKGKVSEVLLNITDVA